jgi:TolB-like protein
LAKSSVEISPSPAAVVEELDRIAASASFRKAAQCLKLLRHVTTLSLEGRTNQLKEYSLGVAVFDRAESYDPRIDPIVRLEARRLRLKLAEYYRLEGTADPVVIDLPKGAYVPEFRWRVAETVPEPIARAKRHFGQWLAATTLTLAITASAGYILMRRPAARAPQRPLIAVIGFKNLAAAPETAWVASAIAELLNIDLRTGVAMRAIPLENIARMRTELSIVPQATYNAGTLQQIRADLGADYVITGAYVDDRRRVHLDLTLFDARLGRQVAAMGEDAGEEHLADLTRRFAARIRTQLGVRLVTNEDVTPRLDAAAMEPYARGMERLRESDALSARGYLEQAATADPSNPLIHSGLAAAWAMLGLDARAKKEAQLAFESSSGLSRVEQLEIEGRYRTAAHEWPRAIQVYEALVTLLPDDLEYGLLLASVETNGDKALATIARLRSLPGPLSDDPRIDLAEARAAGILSDFVHTRQAAQNAAKKAKAHRARLQYAKARLLESGAMQNLAIAGFADVRGEARQICAELGDLACVAAADRINANNMIADDKLDDAKRLYRSVLDVANDIGNLNEKLNALSGLAYADQMRGNLKAAEASDRDALKIGMEMGAQKVYPVELDLAQVLTAEGRWREARPLIEDARKSSRQFGEREGIGLSDAALAEVLACEGNFAEAILEYREALQTLREVNEPELVRQTLIAFGQIELDQGDFAGARSNFEEARNLNRKIRPSVLAEVDMAFARLSFETNQWEEARQKAATALSAFAAADRKADQYEAAALLSRSLLKLGDIASAANILTQYPSPDETALPVLTTARFAIAQSLVLANTGKRAEAARTIESISSLGFALLKKDVLAAREALAKTRAVTSARNLSANP